MPRANTNTNGSFDYQFGIHQDNIIYTMFDWVCGRFSLWSAAGIVSSPPRQYSGCLVSLYSK
jgi:glucose-6-phosphate isomerase